MLVIENLPPSHKVLQESDSLVLTSYEAKQGTIYRVWQKLENGFTHLFSTLDEKLMRANQHSINYNCVIKAYGAREHDNSALHWWYLESLTLWESDILASCNVFPYRNGSWVYQLPYIKVVGNRVLVTQFGGLDC